MPINASIPWENSRFECLGAYELWPNPLVVRRRPINSYIMTPLHKAIVLAMQQHIGTVTGCVSCKENLMLQATENARLNCRSQSLSVT